MTISRRILYACLPLMWAAAPATPPQGAMLDVTVASMRSTKGQVMICLTSRPRYFPDCSGDPDSRHLTVSATSAPHIRFDHLMPGLYALSLVHDENANGKLDTSLGIPREGFGFSRNPRIMFGPPGFKAARFQVSEGLTSQHIRMKYML